jgi:hypothetical protein
MGDAGELDLDADGRDAGESKSEVRFWTSIPLEDVISIKSQY